MNRIDKMGQRSTSILLVLSILSIRSILSIPSFLSPFLYSGTRQDEQD